MFQQAVELVWQPLLRLNRRDGKEPPGKIRVLSDPRHRSGLKVFELLLRLVKVLCLSEASTE